jgi:hypothetical protein
MRLESFLGLKSPGCGINHPKSTSTRVKKNRAILLLRFWDFIACYRVTFTLVGAVISVGIIARAKHEAMLTGIYLPYGFSNVEFTGIDDVQRTVLSTLHVVKRSEGHDSYRKLLLL